jgi:hypothetical protein
MKSMVDLVIVFMVKNWIVDKLNIVALIIDHYMFWKMNKCCKRRCSNMNEK